jgi:magnesium transporter
METNETQARQNLIKGYFELFPSEAALVLDTFPAQKVLDYLVTLSEDTAREVFTRLNADLAVEVIRIMDDHMFDRIFTGIDTHHGSRLLLRLEDSEAQPRLDRLPPVVAREVRDFMSFKPDSAGFLMDAAVTAFKPENTIEVVLERIRKSSDRKITSVYVVDEESCLVGELSLQQIAVSLPETRVKDLMQPSKGVDAYASTDEVVEILEKGNFLQLPVTDVNNKLIGVIRNEALLDATREEAAENIQAMFGASREERALSKVMVAVKSRLPWLHVNLATAFLASLIVGFYEDTIAQITILAVFLPVVAGQSGNTGSQALAVTMRGLALREIRISQWFRVARKEITVGFINGVVVALVTAVIVYFWADSLGISIVIAISMIISMMIAGLSGAVIPVALKALGQDPAPSSSIILTTVTDIAGFFSFLGLASALSSALGIV